MKIHPSAYIHASALILGDVSLGEGASVWPGAVLRGDYNSIHVGKNTNIQDLALLHIREDLPCILGDNITVGHGALVHACRVEDNVLIGMGAILLDGCCIGKGSWVGAGSLVPPGMIVPPGVLVLGSPAKILRNLSEDEMEDHLKQNAAYAQRAQDLKKEGEVYE